MQFVLCLEHLNMFFHFLYGICACELCKCYLGSFAVSSMTIINSTHKCTDRTLEISRINTHEPH